MFYRVAKFFYKKDGLDAFRAVGIVTVVQGLILGAIVFGNLRLIFGLAETEKYMKRAGDFGVIVGIILLILNYFRYKGKYWIFSQKWKTLESDRQRKLRGLLVILGIFFTFFLIIWMGTSGYRE